MAVGWQPHLWPQPDQLVHVDESAHVVVRTFGKDDFVDLEALARVVEIPGESGPLQ
jgi:hypothetical protein